MPTKKKRVNITVSKDVAQLIESIAKHREISQSRVVVDLIERALDATEKGWRNYRG